MSSAFQGRFFFFSMDQLLSKLSRRQKTVFLGHPNEIKQRVYINFRDKKHIFRAMHEKKEFLLLTKPSH